MPGIHIGNTNLNARFSWARYWETQYKSRVIDGDGTIGDEALLSTEMKYVLNNNLFNKIAYWVDNDLGTFTGNPALKVPIVCFTFDDGGIGEYLIWQLFASKGIGRGTSYINTEYIGGINYQGVTCLTWSQIAEMQAGGWDFEDHSWSHVIAGGVNPGGKLTGLTNAQIIAEMENLNADFAAHGLPYPWHHAAPVYDIDFDRVLPIIAKYRKSFRTREIITLNSSNYFSYKNITWWAYQQGTFNYATDEVAIKVYIDKFIKYNEPCLLMGHAANTDAYRLGLEAVIDYCYLNGITPMTVVQYYNHINAYRNKLFNIIEGTNDGTLKDYKPLVYFDSGFQTDKQGMIIFNDTLANISVPVADHYKNKGYRVGFWDDEDVNAIAYNIPNNTKYYDEQAVTVNDVANTIVFPFIINTVFYAKMPFYLTGTTAPGNLSFNTKYYVKAIVGTSGFTASATSGGVVIDILDAGVGVKCSTYGYRDDFIIREGIANCTVHSLAERQGTFDYSYGSYGGNLSECGIELLKNADAGGSSCYLYMQFNLLGGDIPKEFGYWGKGQFTHIDFSNNQITGGLINLVGINPIIVFGNLSLLRFRYNLINEEIPDGFSSFIGLVTLELEYNLIHGSIPRSLGACIEMVNFRLNNNNLSGIIPVELNTMTKIQRFQFNNNGFTSYEAGAVSVGMTALVDVNFSVNAIADASEINKILADCVLHEAANGTNVTLNLTGGTNAAPTGQGITDKNALNAAGWTVTTN